jgi:dihydrofolate reductase
MASITSDPAISLDGFIAGPDQDLEHPLGVGAEHLHRWMFEQPEENAPEIDAICSAGAYIMGRNMFGPDRGDWDLGWHGWWGDDPPYHGPVFVLGHRPRDPVEMQGGTTFHFVTGGIEEALRLAREAAGDRHISVCGGASTINQYLAAGYIDELRLHVAPVVLGAGEAVFRDLGGLSFEVASSRSTSLVTHVTLRR